MTDLEVSIPERLNAVSSPSTVTDNHPTLRVVPRNISRRTRITFFATIGLMACSAVGLLIYGYASQFRTFESGSDTWEDTVKLNSFNLTNCPAITCGYTPAHSVLCVTPDGIASFGSLQTAEKVYQNCRRRLPSISTHMYSTHTECLNGVDCRVWFNAVSSMLTLHVCTGSALVSSHDILGTWNEPFTFQVDKTGLCIFGNCFQPDGRFTMRPVHGVMSGGYPKAATHSGKAPKCTSNDQICSVVPVGNNYIWTIGGSSDIDVHTKHNAPGIC